ncbi:MAG: DUF4330 domain-containing protein [Defluviitaleaceae bacterium]|nr:DUF4330 domain-containing protein [Defluviitaleaceae bacterium]
MFKDSKLFGLVNIIDLFIVIGLIGVVIFGIYQFSAGDGIVAIAPETRTFEISFFAPEIESFSAEALRVGATVFDHGRNVSLGTVTEVNIDEAMIWNADQYGNTVLSNKEGFSSVEVIAVLDAVPSEHGITIAGNRYGIGHSLAIRAGQAIIFGRISGLEEIS